MILNYTMTEGKSQSGSLTLRLGGKEGIAYFIQNGDGVKA
jgi:hypothetical protein